MLLREKFWGLSFEERKVYGMDIPRRLHVRATKVDHNLGNRHL
jgi:hypothetical protein